MNIYRCAIAHRSGAMNDCIYQEVMYIEADCALTAYVKAKEVTKNINHVVYEPDIKLYSPPSIKYTCTSNEVKRDYGILAWKEAEEETRYITWRQEDSLDWC